MAVDASEKGDSVGSFPTAVDQQSLSLKTKRGVQKSASSWPELPSIIVRGLNGDIQLWNSSAELAYGWSKQEVVGKVTHSLFQTQFPCPVEEINRHLLANKIWEGELIHTMSDGSKVRVKSRWELQEDEKDQTCRVFEINRDFERLPGNLSFGGYVKWQAGHTWRLIKEKRWWWLMPMLLCLAFLLFFLAFTENYPVGPLSLE